MTIQYPDTDPKFPYPFDLAGQKVVIIGGGTSLSGFDFSRVQNAVTFGCNFTACLLQTSVLVSIDPNFIRNYSQEIRRYAALGGVAILGRRKELDLDRVPAIMGTIDVTHEREYNPDPPEFSVSGSNTGYAALSLAIQSRPSEIHLLGMDMRGGPTGKHFYGPLRHGTSPADVMRNWHRPFEQVPPVTNKLGIKIINWVGSPDSTITAFERQPLEKFPCM